MKYLLKISFFLFLLFANCEKKEYEKVNTDKEIGSTITLRKYIRESFDASGVIQWRLIAEESYVFADEQKTVLYNFEFEEYEDGVYNSHLSCERGELNHSEKQLKLNGNVKLSTPDNKTLYTSELVYFLDEKRIESDAKVHIFLDGTNISGTGLRSDKDLKQVTILNPDAVTTGNPFKEKEE